jgi:cell wall-associated NlpC family hydrolase
VSDDIQSRFVKRESKTTESTTETNSFGSGMMDWVKEKYSAMLDVLPNQITNVMLYRFIEDWYGTRYRMGGTTKSGVDCSAFVQNLYQYVFGLNLLRTAWMQFESSKYINNVSDLKEGDLVFFRINSSRITHVGVYLKNNFFVHSASSKGVSIANLTSAYWSKYFAGGGRVKE